MGDNDGRTLEWDLPMNASLVLALSACLALGKDLPIAYLVDANAGAGSRTSSLIGVSDQEEDSGNSDVSHDLLHRHSCVRFCPCAPSAASAPRFTLVLNF